MNAHLRLLPLAAANRLLEHDRSHRVRELRAGARGQALRGGRGSSLQRRRLCIAVAHRPLPVREAGSVAEDVVAAVVGLDEAEALVAVPALRIRHMINLRRLYQRLR